MFQSTPSGGKATEDFWSKIVSWFDVSIHAFRGEGDFWRQVMSSRVYVFQSTPSGGKATYKVVPIQRYLTRFNPRLPGGRRPSGTGRGTDVVAVSIHAFRGEGDTVYQVKDCRLRVSIHAFRGEGDQVLGRRPAGFLRFNPRLPGGRRRSSRS